MLAKIHIAKKELQLDDETYRAKLHLITGKTSSGKMSPSELDKVLATFRDAGWKPKRHRPRATHSVHRKIYALWTELKAKGLVTARHPDGFVKRMTGKDRPEMLGSNEAQKVIEGLKAIKQRSGRADKKSIKQRSGAGPRIRSGGQKAVEK
jgi:phage gp16-like protein